MDTNLHRRIKVFWVFKHPGLPLNIYVGRQFFLLKVFSSFLLTTFAPYCKEKDGTKTVDNNFFFTRKYFLAFVNNSYGKCPTAGSKYLVS
jgi:hypothetical protein